MFKHLSGIVSLLLCFCAASAFAQETPQSALNDGNIAKASSLLETQSTDSDIEVAVSGLCGQVQLALEQGQLDKASELLNTLDSKKSDLKKKSGWNVVILWLKAELAHRNNDVKDYKAGLNDVLEAINVGAKVEDSWAGTVNYLLSVAEEDNSHARGFAEDAIKALHESKNYYEEGLAELRLAELEWDRDKQRRALKSYDNALRAFRKSSNDAVQVKIADTQLVIASKLIEAGEIRAAKSRLSIAEKEIDMAGNPADLKARLDDLNQKLAD